MSDKTRIVQGRNGSTFQLGKIVSDFKVMENGQLIAEAEAKVIFDSTMTRLSGLIDAAEKLELEDQGRSFMLTSTMNQLAIVTMASALEVYGKKRLIEIERDGRIKNWNEVIHKTGLSLEQLDERRKKSGRGRIEELVEERSLALGDLDVFGRVFEKGVGIKVSDISSRELYRIIALRHEIVHGGLRLDTLYMDGNTPYSL